MKTYTIAALVLVAAGILALIYGQVTYTKNSETAELGPIEFTVEEKETVNVPTWAGVGAIIAGVGMMAYPLLKR